MGKVRRLYVCSSCERSSAQWSGRCAACGGWGTVSERPASGSRFRSPVGVAERSAPVLTLAPDEEARPVPTGFPAIDRVVGGGLVPGAVLLVAGAPGIGKSTLLLQLASRLTAAGHPCLIASGEESRGQVAARARRLGLDGAALAYVGGRDVGDVIAAALRERPAVLIVDSIQTIRDPEAPSLPGGVAQVRGCTDALVALAKEHLITVILVGHVTKDGDVAGPRTLEHVVDTVLSFEGDARSGLRVLVAGKNRFGHEGEVAWFEMTPDGLVETDAGPPAGAAREPGCATALALAGGRALTVDVQALVISTDGPPRRQVAGLDPRRFHIVAAVVDQSLHLRLARAEVFGAASGGYRLEDPGVDLAVAAALASAASGQPPPGGTAFVGEVTLTGSLRPVGGLEQRLSSAVAAGMDRVVIPRGKVPVGPPKQPLDLVCAARVEDALAWAIGPK